MRDYTDFLRRHTGNLVSWIYPAEVMAAHLTHVIERGRTDPSDLLDIAAAYDLSKQFFPTALEACGESRAANVLRSFEYYVIATDFVTSNVKPEPQSRDEVNVHIRSTMAVLEQLTTETDIAPDDRNAYILTQSFFANLAHLGNDARTLEREEAEDD